MGSLWLRGFSFAVGAVAAVLLLLALATGPEVRENMETCARPSWEQMRDSRDFLSLLFSLHAYDGDGATWSVPPGGNTAQWSQPGPAGEDTAPSVVTGTALPAALFRDDPESDAWIVGLPLTAGTTVTLPPSTDAIAPVLSDMTFAWALAGTAATNSGPVTLLDLAPASARITVTLDGNRSVTVKVATADEDTVDENVTVSGTRFLALSRTQGAWRLREVDEDGNVETHDLTGLGTDPRDLFLASARAQVRVPDAETGTGSLRLGFLGVFGRTLPDLALGSLAKSVIAEVDGNSAACRESQRTLEAAARELVARAEEREREARDAVRAAETACRAAEPAADAEEVPPEWRGPGGRDLRIDPSNVLGIPREEMASHAATCRAIVGARPTVAGEGGGTVPVVLDPRDTT